MDNSASGLAFAYAAQKQRAMLCQTGRMYNPPHFAEKRPELLWPVIQERAFGTLVAMGPNGLDAAHLPVEVDPEAGLLRCHVARPNAIWKSVLAFPEVLWMFLGADHYISPQWYPSKAEHSQVVPTWNYETIHVRGVASIFEDSTRLLAHLEALTQSQEERLPAPWGVGDAPAAYIERQMRAILGIEVRVTSIEGKFKLSQNRNAADLEGARAGLDSLGTPASQTVARAMQRLRPDGH